MQTHKNAATGYTFKGGNALILTQAMQAQGWEAPEWMTPAQAARAKMLPTEGASPVQVVLNDKPFTLYNVAQLAPVKVTTTERSAVANYQTPEEVAEEERQGQAYDQQRAEYADRAGHVEGPDYEPPVNAMGEEEGSVEDFPVVTINPEPQPLQVTRAAAGLIIRPDFLRAAATFAASDESRAYLCAVYVHVKREEDGGARVEYVATDGHRLAALSHELEEREGFPDDWGNGSHERGFLVGVEEIAKLPKVPAKAKEMEKYFTLQPVEGDEHRAVVGTLEGARVPLKLIDAVYPDFERLFYQNPFAKPEAVESVSVGFNTRLLADVHKLVTACPVTHEKCPSVRLTVRGPSDPVLIESRNPDGYTMRGLIMPMRI